MNKRGHVLNGVLLAVGMAVVFDPSGDVSTYTLMVQLLPPIVLGAMLPDIDTAFGTHRKTLHNLAVLGGFLAYPYFFANLSYVWIGVATHYVLDVIGSKRGIALFYPYAEEYGLPIGVTVSSDHAELVTILISGFEVGVLAAVHYYVVDLTAMTLRAPVASRIPEALLAVV